MTLDSYLRLVGLSDEEFGKRINRDRSIVGRYRRGQLVPPTKVIKLITEVTNRAVTYLDFMT